jgi:hypothetical protein
MDLTDKQLQTLRHMLGIDDPYKRRPEPYRNYYCAPKVCPELRELERLGAVRQYATTEQWDWFECTDEGRLSAMRSFRSIQKNKAARRYSVFLDCRECNEGLTFREFLTAPYYAEARARA